MKRSPIISVLGHVDHGKSSILDALRDSNIIRGEAGGITQAIGASIMPLDTITKRCGNIAKQLNMTISVPGILFIDTPGHAAFTSLRKRGGNLADIAIVVIDINEGFKPQTLEAIEILRSYKTPFIIAANKLDLVNGYKVVGNNFLQSLKNQSPDVVTAIETKLYEIVGVIHEKFGLESERFDRVSDYTKQVAIIPCSALKSVGLEEILMVLTGLSQKYLEQNLMLNASGPGKGVILEVKETLGLGTTLDLILHDGTLRVGDEVLIGSLNGPFKTKVKALMMPQPLVDMRDKKSKYRGVKEVVAATGVKVSCTNLESSVSAGMPLEVIKDNKKELIEKFSSQINDVGIDTEKSGIIVKADTIGSLEALIKLLKDKSIPIRKASIGNISKKDIGDAESNFEEDPSYSCILGFNIKQEESTDKVKIVVKDVIYSLLDEYEEWVLKLKEEIEAKELDKITKPGLIEVLQNCIFRQSNPCIAGVEVLKGNIKSGSNIIDRNGNKITYIKSLQADNDSLTIAERGRQVAASFMNVTAGRQIIEGEIYYTDLTEDEFKKLKKLKKYLSGEEIEVIKDIAMLKRKHNPLWGV